MKIKLSILLVLLILMLQGKSAPVSATSQYSNTYIYAETQNNPTCMPFSPYSCYSAKAFDFTTNPSVYKPTLMQVVSVVWVVDEISARCVHNPAARCASPNGCTGPGSDIWAYWTPGAYNWGWISTRHTYDFDHNYPYYSAPYTGDFYTAYSSSLYANPTYFFGLYWTWNCPAIDWFPRP